MPTAPKRFGETERTTRKRGWADDKIRGTAEQRGYDTAWRKLAKAFKSANTLCCGCLSRGVVTEARHADHIVPFNGIDDPLRLDWDNLQALCEHCHMVKTGKQK